MKEKAALEDWHRRVVYGTVGALWLTGAVWLYLRYIVGIEGGAASSALMKGHGAAAMAFLVLLGTLLWGHVPAGWSQARRRVSGVLVATVCGLLVVSGWSLYYSADPVRGAASVVHSVLGLAIPAALIVHARMYRRVRKMRKIPS